MANVSATRTYRPLTRDEHETTHKYLLQVILLQAPDEEVRDRFLKSLADFAAYASTYESTESMPWRITTHLINVLNYLLNYGEWPWEQ